VVAWFVEEVTYDCARRKAGADLDGLEGADVGRGCVGEVCVRSMCNDVPKYDGPVGDVGDRGFRIPEEVDDGLGGDTSRSHEYLAKPSVDRLLEVRRLPPIRSC
jgi:hypothetical protein